MGMLDLVLGCRNMLFSKKYLQLFDFNLTKCEPVKWLCKYLNEKIVE